MMTWFPDPGFSPTNPVYTGSRAALTASDTLRSWRSGRGANLRTGLWPQGGTASQIFFINSLYSRSLVLPIPDPWLSLGNRTYKGGLCPPTRHLTALLPGGGYRTKCRRSQAGWDRRLPDGLRTPWPTVGNAQSKRPPGRTG